MFIGYVRNLGSPEDFEKQLSLVSALVHPDHLHIERRANATSKKSPARDWMLETLRPNDVAVVRSLLCFSLSYAQIVACIEQIEKENAYVLCIAENFDTRNAEHRSYLPALKSTLRSLHGGRRASIIQAMESASLQGRNAGRPKSVTSEKLEAAAKLIGTQTMAQIAQKVGLSRSSLYSAGLTTRSKKN